MLSETILLINRTDATTAGTGREGRRIFHMWTAPSLQGVWQCFDQIACVHMSGLFVRSHMNAGQDGFRDKSSKQKSDLTVLS